MTLKENQRKIKSAKQKEAEDVRDMGKEIGLTTEREWGRPKSQKGIQEHGTGWVNKWLESQREDRR